MHIYFVSKYEANTLVSSKDVLNSFPTELQEQQNVFPSGQPVSVFS